MTVLNAQHIVLAFLLLTTPAMSADWTGRATVVDGDTIDLERAPKRIRLDGIDAPEGKQTCDDADGGRYLCGSQSADYLASLIGRNGRVTCAERDRDRYGRIVAVCQVGATELNREMVRAGWALDYRQYSGGRYSREEREAEAKERGIWAGAFVPPWNWRRGERMASEPALPSGPGDCQIKGNISKSGQIYHLPGSRAYPKTVIDEAKGERWFCSEAEAKAAGWRAVRG